MTASHSPDFHVDCSAIILAAGNGSRLKASQPKILQKVGGLALLDHAIKASQQVVSKVVVVTKPDFSMDQLRYSDGVLQAFRDPPKGTADAVRCGMEALEKSECNKHNKCDKCSDEDSWIFVLYADNPLISPETLRNALKLAHTCDKTAAVILAMNSEGNKNLGKLESDGEGGVKGIVEAKDAAADASETSKRTLLPLCNCGLLFRKSFLDRFLGAVKPSPVTGETYITELIRIAYENGYKCRYFEGDPRELSGANTFAEIAALERNFQDIMREKFMENGVKLVAPETVFFSYDTEIEPDVVVHPYVIFGEGVRVRRGAAIGPFCVLEGADVGAAAVGPFARLRPESEIHDGAKIGNFVEIKKSIIEEGTKVNHLSYIGDSTVGSGTNIGAGTITCNYDGKNKHRTQIGCGVFVGSNTALVAPVKIGDGATIGAGSVITEDVSSEDLAIARGRQRNIEGWKKKPSQQ